MRRLLLGLTATIALTAGCDGSDLAPSEIIGGTWRLVALQEPGAAAVIVEDPSRYRVQFGEDGRLSVNSDCNSCGGSYALTGGSLDVGILACTRVFCGDASLDGRYTAALDGAQSVRLDEGEMTIQGSSGTLTFRK